MVLKKNFNTCYLVISCLVFGQLYACDASHKKSWDTCIAEKKALLTESHYQLILSQYKAYAEKTSPTIVDARIKNIAIEESGEQLVDVQMQHHDRISMLSRPTHVFSSPDHNSGLPSASKMRRSLWLKLLTMIEKLDNTAKDFGFSPGQMNIKVFEGLRDIATQEKLFTNKCNEIKEAHPLFSDDEIFSEAVKWVSPVRNNVPVHSTGGAVDIRIWDNKNNCFLDVGSFGVVWGKNPNAPTFSEDLSNEQKNNRLYQLIAATQAGLTNYSYEYWHFSTGDRYASFWNERDPAKRKAIYSSIN